MKKLLLSLVFILSTLWVNAQFNVYHPFPDSNAYWGEESEIPNTVPPNGGGFTISDYGYLLDGDTVVAGRTYYKVYGVGGESNTGPVAPYKVFCCAIRSDSMKHVFTCCQTGGFMYKQDTLLYDFNMKVGDTIKGGLTSPYTTVLYVDSIDSVNINGNYRKRFSIATDQQNPHQVVDEIIEGIGSSQGLLQIITGPVLGYYIMLCFRQNGNVLFSYNSYFASDTCIVWGPAGLNIIKDPIASFNIYPNPASNSVKLMYSLPSNTSKAELKLYNAMGQLVKARIVEPESTTDVEDVSNLPNGVYYYTLVVNGSVMAANKLVIVR